MKLNWKLIATIAATQLTLTAFAADDADLAALKKQLQELDMKVRLLEHQPHGRSRGRQQALDDAATQTTHVASIDR